MVPWSRFAVSLKPNVAYLDLNLPALWRKQTTLPSLAYPAANRQLDPRLPRKGDDAGYITAVRQREARQRQGRVLVVLGGHAPIEGSSRSVRHLDDAYVSISSIRCGQLTAGL